MLNCLQIRNIALIESLDIDFSKGMTVLTGETGAGKSIIIDSVNLILGSRASKGLIRYGEKEASVQGIFSVGSAACDSFDAIGIDVIDNEVVVRREIYADGKSVCRINGVVVTQAMLRDVSESLVNIHGQQDNQALFNPSNHFRYLDSYAENAEELLAYQNENEKYKSLKKQLDKLLYNEKERNDRIDLLRYQTDELERAALCEGEKEALLEERDIAQNAEELNVASAKACDILYDDDEVNAYMLVSLAGKALAKVESIPAAQKTQEKIIDIQYAIEDVVGDIRSLTDGVDFSRERLDEIEERLDTITRMERKYGGSESAALKYFKHAQNELAELDMGEEIASKVEQEINQSEKRRAVLAAALSETRKKAAKKLSKEIESVLCELDMPKARFFVKVEDAPYTDIGADSVEFLICPNVGEELKPLARFASGGELSRVMLAIKSILYNADDADTLIFDEIDTGVSGSAAQKIARKLKALSLNKQVICVSHQPQLAVVAENHLLIKKQQSGDRTVTGVSVLDHDQHIREIARIIDGDNPSEAAILHVKAMLNDA